MIFAKVDFAKVFVYQSVSSFVWVDLLGAVSVEVYWYSARVFLQGEVVVFVQRIPSWLLFFDRFFSCFFDIPRRFDLVDPLPDVSQIACLSSKS